MLDHKQCCKCGVEKDLTSFNRDNTRNGDDGRSRKCALCRAQEKVMYRARQTAEAAQKHKDDCMRRYHEHLLVDPDYLAKLYEKRVVVLLQNGQLAAETVRQKAATRAWYLNNTERALARDKNKRVAVVQRLGGCCVECGYDKDVRALVLDHKRGDGHADRKRLGTKLYRYYYNHLEEAENNLQVLCCNCNAIKAIVCDEHNVSRRITRATGSK